MKRLSPGASGSKIRDAAKETVYPNQKADWIEQTFESVNWEDLGMAIQHHFRSGTTEDALRCVVAELKGVSHRKGGFTIGMSGGYEFMCIDSHVADFAGLEDTEQNSLEFTDTSSYLEQCDKILENIPNKLDFPPLLVQWSLYDYMRGEHAMHNAFYREVLPEVLYGT